MARNPKSTNLRTPEQARQWLRDNGMTISAFAKQQGVDRSVVQDLLRGKTLGRYGDSHSAAVALGLKASPDSAINLHKPPRMGAER